MSSNRYFSHNQRTKNLFSGLLLLILVTPIPSAHALMQICILWIPGGRTTLESTRESRYDPGYCERSVLIAEASDFAGHANIGTGWAFPPRDNEGPTKPTCSPIFSRKSGASAKAIVGLSCSSGGQSEEKCLFPEPAVTSNANPVAPEFFRATPSGGKEIGVYMQNTAPPLLANQVPGMTGADLQQLSNLIASILPAATQHFNAELGLGKNGLPGLSTPEISPLRITDSETGNPIGTGNGITVQQYLMNIFVGVATSTGWALPADSPNQYVKPKPVSSGFRTNRMHLECECAYPLGMRVKL